MSNRTRIAVIGAGLGGLAVTAALRTFGVDAQIYEQAAGFTRVGAGIHVAPNAVKALLGLGLSREVLEEKAYMLPQSRYRDYDSGKLIVELPYVGEALERNGAPYTMWHRADLHAALLDLVDDALIHRSKSLIGIDTRGDRVVASFADGTSVTADAVVASDGLRSPTRDILFNIEAPHYTHRVAYRSVIPREAIDEADLDPHCKWWGPDRHFVHYHIKAGEELAFTTSVADPTFATESWTATGDVEVLRDSFAEFHPHVQAILRACESVNRWGIHARDPLAEWSDGAVVLMGDACHTMPPYMGQGAAMAMEDAIVLARCIAEVGGEPSCLPGAFGRYEATRKERTTQMQAISEANTWGRINRDTDWAYGYDAWSAPLAAADPVTGTST